MASFVRSGVAQLAYRVDGEGPFAILFYSGFLVTIDMYDEEPHLARFCSPASPAWVALFVSMRVASDSPMRAW